MIRNQYVITKKVYLAWTKENLGKRANVIRFVADCVLSAVSIWQVFEGEWYFKVTYLYFAIFFTYCAFLKPFVEAHRHYKWMAKCWGSYTWLLTVDFYDEGFVFYERNVSYKYSYKDILKVKFLAERVNIYTKDEMCLRIYNGGFTVGNREELISRFVSAGLI